MHSSSDALIRQGWFDKLAEDMHSILSQDVQWVNILMAVSLVVVASLARSLKSLLSLLWCVLLLFSHTFLVMKDRPAAGNPPERRDLPFFFAFSCDIACAPAAGGGG